MKLNKEIFLNLNNIGIIRTDRLGDMVLTLPMVKVLKRINPNYKIYIIARKYTEILLQNQSLITNYFFIDNQNIIDIINQNKIDAIFSPRSLFKEAYQLYLSKASYRIGTGYRIYSFLYNYKIYEHRKISEYHEAEYNVRMISHITKDNYEVELLPPHISEEINNRIKQLYGEGFIIIHPGSLGSAPKLPMNYWRIIIQSILENTSYKIYITGTNDEVDLCNYLSTKNHRIKNLCGKLKLDELLALISNSRVLMANSTGVIHIAAALNKKVVGFYPNSKHIGSERWGPITKNAIIIKPKFGDDLLNIDKNQILDLYKFI